MMGQNPLVIVKMGDRPRFSLVNTMSWKIELLIIVVATLISMAIIVQLDGDLLPGSFKLKSSLVEFRGT